MLIESVLTSSVMCVQMTVAAWAFVGAKYFATFPDNSEVNTLYVHVKD